MEGHSRQGLAIVVFLVAFALLAGALFSGGKLVLVLLFLVAIAASVMMFLKAKSEEPAGR